MKESKSEKLDDNMFVMSFIYYICIKLLSIAYIPINFSSVEIYIVR